MTQEYDRTLTPVKDKIDLLKPLPSQLKMPLNSANTVRNRSPGRPGLPTRDKNP